MQIGTFFDPQMLGDRGDRSEITSHVQIVYKVMKFGYETWDF